MSLPMCSRKAGTKHEKQSARISPVSGIGTWATWARRRPQRLHADNLLTSELPVSDELHDLGWEARVVEDAASRRDRHVSEDRARTQRVERGKHLDDVERDVRLRADRIAGVADDHEVIRHRCPGVA